MGGDQGGAQRTVGTRASSSQLSAVENTVIKHEAEMQGSVLTNYTESPT